MKTKFILVCFGLFFTLMGCKKDDPSAQKNPDLVQPPANDSIKDIDGNKYGIVTIGNKKWLTSNLKVKHYRNGDAIPNVSSSAWGTLTTGAFCNFMNDTSISEIHGLLYNYYTVSDSRNICPTGWHVPSDTEITQLTDSLGGELIAAGALKSTDTLYWTPPNNGATNSSGFSAYGSGTRAGTTCNIYGGLKNQFFMWSSTPQDSTQAFSRMIYVGSNKVNSFWTTNKKYGMSVRCIND